jgi:hypothetical protein
VYNKIITHGKEPPVKTTAAQSEINNLIKKNNDLLAARAEVLLGERSGEYTSLYLRCVASVIVVNERRIKELQA